MLALLLPVLLSLSPLAAAAEDALQPFVATLQGSVLGLGAPCVIREAPPHGAWTLVYEVTEPMQSGLPLGQPLCEIVHSPSMHLREVTLPVAVPIAAPADEAPGRRGRRGRRR